MTHRSLSRRAALRGAGVAVALPLLEAMSPPRPRAQGPGAAHPNRLTYVYVPNGVHMPAWTPASTGRGFALPELLEPLDPVRDELLALSGLALDPARAHGDGGGDHARAMSSFLTGAHPRKTGGADLRAGVSADQVAARAAGRATRFASLELGCEGGRESGRCDHGYSCAYQVNLSWRGESTPAAKESDPALVFDRLFGRPAPAGSDAAARRERRRRSVLDLVGDDARRLRGGLGAADRRKLDEYLAGVREVESRAAAGTPAPHGPARPAGRPADFGAHARLMADLIVLAFRADLTRVATLVLANDGSNRSYREAGVAEGHHDLSHHGGDPERQAKLRAINRFHVQQFAYLLGRLKAAEEGEGTLLDHGMTVYGSGISDGNTHSHHNLPILLAGRGNGTLAPGRHLLYPAETPLANLHRALLDRMGAPAGRFGDSTGPLPGLGP